MNTIKAIISTLSEEQKQEFLYFLKKKNRRSDTKNISLFQLINDGKNHNLDILLYNKPSKNAFHALCKRLQDSLIDFVATESFAGDTSEELEILKLLLASRIFFEHKHHKIAFKILIKAERNALSLDLYSILNEIYHTKIQYAHLNPNLKLSEIISASNTNMKRFKQELQLNMAYATIKSQLKNKQDLAINEVIVDAFSDFEIELDHTLTFKSLFQLMNITATAAKLQNDYHPISDFMMKVYNIIKDKNDAADKHLYYHIAILNLMALTSFRNKEFKTSTAFTHKMEVEMNKKNRRYFLRFHEKLIVIKALNKNYTGDFASAIKLLKGFPKESLDVSLTLVMCLFQQNNFSEAYGVLKQFNHSDNWYEKKIGWIWVLKKNIIEILLLIELDRLELVLSRMQSFNRKFSSRLKEVGEDRVIAFMKLVSYYYENPDIITTDNFKQKVENSFEWIGSEREDIFVMSFYAWLKAKMEQKNLYQTTLTLAQ